jgi:hypothetical protein
MKLVVEMREVNLWFRNTSKWKELLPYKISFTRTKLCNFVRAQRSIQPCSSPSNISELTGNTIHGNYIYISGDAFWSERRPTGIHPNNEKMCNGNNSRAMKTKMKINKQKRKPT